MAKKLYPFSADKHAHDIELVANRTYNLAQDALADKRYDDYDKLIEQHETADEVLLAIQSGMINYKVAMLDGKTWAKANELVNTASAIRDGLIHKYDEKHNEREIDTIVIDTETTGLYAGEDELLQVSIINSNGEELYNEYVRPTEHTSWQEAMLVNNITPEMVANAKTIDEQLEAINAITSKAAEVIGYNTPFDIRFLEASGVKFNEDIKVTDVMADYSQRHGEWDDYNGRYKHITLIECAAYYDYNWNSAEGQAHNSISDCYATLHCYDKLKEEMQLELESIKEGNYAVEYCGNLYEWIGDDNGKLLLSDVNNGDAVRLSAEDVLSRKHNIAIHRTAKRSKELDEYADCVSNFVFDTFKDKEEGFENYPKHIKHIAFSLGVGKEWKLSTDELKDVREMACAVFERDFIDNFYLKDDKGR